MREVEPRGEVSNRSRTRKGRNHQFDLLRILFATCVLLSHAPEITDGNASRELFTRMTAAMSFGSFGVDGFFLLSGFLIVKSWMQDPELGNFLRKRVLRIVPGYIVAALLSTVVVGLLAPGIPNFFLHLGPRFVPSLLMLGSPMTPEVFPGLFYHDVNGATWTITYEFRCYLLVALFGICGLLRRRWVWLVVMVVMVALMLVMPAHLHWHRIVKVLIGDPNQLFRLTAAFLIGGCFWLYREQIKFRRVLGFAAGAGLIALRVFAPAYLEAGVLLGGGYLLFYLGELELTWLGWMKRVPDISYGLYLYGWPVECLWIWYTRGSPWVTFAGSTVICFGLGWLSWHFVERPMLKLKKRPTAALPVG